MIEIKNEFNKEFLKLIKDASKKSVEVGWFNETYPNGKKIGSIMKLLNDGGLVMTARGIIKIPARPFFNNGVEEAVKEINMVKITIKDLLNKKFYGEIGTILVEKIRQAMIELTTPPLADKTIEIRKKKNIYNYGLEKPLIETGTALKTLTKRVK